MQRFLICLLLFLAPLSVFASSPKSLNSVPAIAKFVEDSGAKIIYVGRRHSLDVWMAIKNDIVQTLYSTIDGQGMVTNNMLFAPDGKEASNDMMTEFGEKNPDLARSLFKDVVAAGAKITPVGETPDLAQPENGSKTTITDIARAMRPSERLWQDLNSSNNLQFGSKAAPIVFAFVDPRCGHCLDFWNKITPIYVAEGKINLQLVPVGLLGPESVALAARILGAKDPTQSWLDFKSGKELAANELADAVGQAKVAQNGDLMSKWKIQSTPFLVYRSQANKVRLLRGSPENIDTLLADMGLLTKLPAKLPAKAPTKPANKEAKN